MVMRAYMMSSNASCMFYSGETSTMCPSNSSGWFFIETGSRWSLSVPAKRALELTVFVPTDPSIGDALMNEAIPTTPNTQASPKNDVLLKWPPALLSISTSSTLKSLSFPRRLFCSSSCATLPSESG